MSTSLLDKDSTNGSNVISLCSRGVGDLNWKRFDRRDIHLLSLDRDQTLTDAEPLRSRLPLLSMVLGAYHTLI